MDLRQKAQKRIKEWKKKRMWGWEISEKTGVGEAEISRIFRGKGIVSDRACEKILEAK